LLLSGANVTESGSVLSFPKAGPSRVEVALQSLTVPSALAVARVVPSGEKATETTLFLWPGKDAIFSPRSRSQSVTTVLASFTVASFRPSGENLKRDVLRACHSAPGSVRTTRQVTRSQSLTVWSSPHVASVLPSGENATAWTQSLGGVGKSAT